MKEVIRLTNKTAIALRKNAQKIRTAYFAAMVIISVLLGAAGVFLGFMWLPAVPLMIAAICLIDWALMIASRSRYLLLVGQAICTEAAAREISADKSEKRRREQAAKDFLRVKADMEKEIEKTQDVQPFFEEKSETQMEEQEEELLPAVSHQQETAVLHRRRKQNPLTIIRSEQIK